MASEQRLLEIVLAALFARPMQQLMGVECVVHAEIIGKVEIEPEPLAALPSSRDWLPTVQVSFRTFRLDVH